MKAAVEARGLKFGYRPGLPVLDGVDIFASRGEIVGVIGPNGSGKTTLLNLLASTARPESGEIRLFGDSASSLSGRERARRLAMVPQEPKVAFPFTVIEIVLMGRAPYLGRFELEKKGDVGKARDAMDKTGILELASRRFHELSGGERQRVMLAKALCQESGILLLDEPTSFLDLRHQVEIHELVKSLTRERGLAVISVSHDLNLAASYSDRVVVIAEGKVAAEGAPEEVLRPSLLTRVYGIEVGSIDHPSRHGKPLLFPLARQRQEGG